MLAWLLSLLRSWFAAPAPLLARAGVTPGTTVTLRWPADAYPLDVYAETAILNEVADGCSWWNGQAGRAVFAPPTEPLPETEAAMDSEALRAGLRGVVLVRGGGLDPGHGDTDERYDKRSGALLNCLVTLPFEAANAEGVTRHELGHVLGLAHAEDGTLMGPHMPVDGVPPLADYQRKAVREP